MSVGSDVIHRSILCGLLANTAATLAEAAPVELLCCAHHQCALLVIRWYFTPRNE
jgi:hypothetical protein